MPDKTNLIVCRVLFTSLRLRQATSHPWHVLATDRREAWRRRREAAASAGNYGATSRTTPSPSSSPSAVRHLTNMAKSGQTIGLAWPEHAWLVALARNLTRIVPCLVPATAAAAEVPDMVGWLTRTSLWHVVGVLIIFASQLLLLLPLLL